MNILEKLKKLFGKQAQGGYISPTGRFIMSDYEPVTFHTLQPRYGVDPDVMIKLTGIDYAEVEERLAAVLAEKAQQDADNAITPVIITPDVHCSLNGKILEELLAKYYGRDND